MRILVQLYIIFSFALTLAQPEYDDCTDAFLICPNQTFPMSNYESTVKTCAGCEDQIAGLCFVPYNTVWMKFETNDIGGNIQISITDLIFKNTVNQSARVNAVLLKATKACDPSTYSIVGSCVSNQVNNFYISAGGLQPSSVYYLMVGGDKSDTTIAAEFTFNVKIGGNAVNRTNGSVSINADDYAICKNDIVTFDAVADNCPNRGDFQWYVNGNLFAVTKDSTFQTASLADGDIVTVTTSCYKTCPLTIARNSLPINVTNIFVDAGFDSYTNKNIPLKIQGSTNASHYYWTPNYHIADTALLKTIVFPDKDMTYTLVAEENGCIMYDNVTIKAIESIVIPTTFTPNGDGINDVFEILYIERFPNNYVQIFDRWGQVLYESVSYDFYKAWNGKVGNGNLAEGVYFYHITLNDEYDSTFTGSVTVLK